MDELCELANAETKKKCQKLKIKLDYTDKDGVLIYHEKAQDIFNKVLDKLDDKYNKPKLTLYNFVTTEEWKEYGSYYIDIDEANMKASVEEYLDLCHQDLEEYPFELFVDWLKNKGIKVRKHTEKKRITIEY